MNFNEYVKANEHEEILWSDRKRIMGLPWTFTKYSVTENRLQVKKGFFSSSIDDILLYRILDIEVSQSFWQKLFGVGTVTVHSRDRSNPVCALKNIKRPIKLSNYLSTLVEKEREEKMITGREMYGSDGFGQRFDEDYDE